MADSLKQKTISGMIWNAVERFGSSFFLFVSNLILARLLSPDDFGCIGMLMVFISISDAIVDGGFGSALIQKKKPTEADYSTVFYWNLFLSVFLYLSLYFAAPSISDFYEIPLLKDVLRIQGIIVIINAFILIQQNILKKQVDFKRIAKINLASIIIGTSFGILFAFLGFGVWSLVVKSLVTGLIQCVIYWLSNHWRPLWVFSRLSFKSLFQFGSFMFLRTIINTLYQNILSLIIGKNFSASTLGYFTQARKLEDVPRNSLSAIINNVTFPIFSEIQDDTIRLNKAAKKCLKSMVYINFPLMMLLIIIADPLFRLLFTDKWIQAVPYFQMLCIYGLITSPIELNNNIIISLGKSNISLVVRIVQCGVGLILVLVGLYREMEGVLLGYILSQYIGFFVVAIATGRMIGYGVIKQCKACLPTFLLSFIIALITYMFSILVPNTNYVLLMCLQCIIYAFLYITLSYLFRMEGFNIYVQAIRKRK
jgi:O-antigen/teichoic acid export membrane protein